MTSGRIARTPAIATRCFCPPLSLLTGRSAYSIMPTLSRAEYTLSTISSRGSPIFSGPNATSSSTIVATVWLSGFWKTMPTFLRTSKAVISFPSPSLRLPASTSLVLMPSTTTCPDLFVGKNKPLSSLDSVLLPLPFIPTNATKLPFSTEKDRFLRAFRLRPSPNE